MDRKIKVLKLHNLERTMVSLKMIKKRERGSLIGQMANFIQESGEMAKEMELDYGPHLKVIAIWVNGKKELLKGKVFIRLAVV